MNSYQKLQKKVEIYEELIQNMRSLIDDLMQKPEEFLADNVELPTLDKEAIKDCARLLSHEIYQHEEKIWKL